MNLIFGVGLNDADYVTRRYEELPKVSGKRKQKLVWICPFYATWKSMLDRCYSPKRQEKQPHYKDCTVCDEWLRFSNFKAWMETQEWEGNQLDKDILFPGNKHYSAKFCVFVSRQVNMFVTEKRKNRGEYPTGVTFQKICSKFKATCMDAGKPVLLGSFDCPQAAFRAWLECKKKLARKLATEQTDQRVAQALISRYENYKET